MHYVTKDTEPSTIRTALAKTRLLGNLPAQRLHRLAQASRLRRYARGDLVPTGCGSQREVLLTVSGVLEISQIAPGGRRFVLCMVGAGEIVGLVGLFGDPQVHYGYTARDDAAVIHLPCSDLHEVFDMDPPSWRDVTRFALDRKAELLGTVLDQVVFGHAEQRIAATLRRLSNLFGVQAAQGTRLRLRLSQDDLADMLCASRQTVNKELRRLEALNVLRCTYNTITILDEEALRRMVDAGA